MAPADPRSTLHSRTRNLGMGVQLAAWAVMVGEALEPACPDNRSLHCKTRSNRCRIWLQIQCDHRKWATKLTNSKSQECLMAAREQDGETEEQAMEKEDLEWGLATVSELARALGLGHLGSRSRRSRTQSNQCCNVLLIPSSHRNLVTTSRNNKSSKPPVPRTKDRPGQTHA